MKINKKLTLVSSIVCIALTGLSASGGKESSGELKVVTSTSIIYDVVANVAGDKADLTGLMGPSQDPHSYEPTPRDMAKVEEADILFLNGFGLEEGLISVLKNVSTNKVVEVSHTPVGNEAEEHEDLDGHDEAEGDDHEDHDGHEDAEHEDHDGHEEVEHEGEHHHGSVDPHSWMSPLNVVHWVEVIRDSLVEADPENAEYYRENAAVYTEELHQLHKEIRETLSVVPAEKRLLVTDHNSLGYFADEYHLEIAGTILPQTSTSSDTSARHLAELVKIMSARQIKALFIGNTAGADIQKLSGAISTELGYPIEILQLLSGSLQEKGEPGDSYIEYMRYNTRLIADGLSL